MSFRKTVLTEKEIEVLVHYIAGGTTSAIAENLHYGPDTIQKRFASARDKAGVNKSATAFFWAVFLLYISKDEDDHVMLWAIFQEVYRLLEVYRV